MPPTRPYPWTVESEFVPVDNRPGCYEYEVHLIHSVCGEVVDSWESIRETANGIQFLDLADCRQIVREIEQDVIRGEGYLHFSYVHSCRKDGIIYGA